MMEDDDDDDDDDANEHSSCYRCYCLVLEEKKKWTGMCGR